MIEELGYRLSTFGGAASRTRCFLHVVNLVAKSLIQQFDMSKKEADVGLDGVVDGKVKCTIVDELAAMDEELEELDGSGDTGGGIYLEENEGDDDIEVEDEGWIDELEDLSEAEREQLVDAILPVKLALVKVSARVAKLTTVLIT